MLVHFAQDGSLVQVGGDDVVLLLIGLLAEQGLLDLQGEAYTAEGDAEFTLTLVYAG